MERGEVKASQGSGVRWDGVGEGWEWGEKGGWAWAGECGGGGVGGGVRVSYHP